VTEEAEAEPTSRIETSRTERMRELRLTRIEFRSQQTTIVAVLCFRAVLRVTANSNFCFLRVGNRLRNLGDGSINFRVPSRKATLLFQQDCLQQ